MTRNVAREQKGDSGRTAALDVASGEKVPDGGFGVDAACVGDVVDFEHWRRARRLVPILVDRFGAAFFVRDAAKARLDDALDADRVARCASLAAEWIGRRSGRLVDEEFHERLHKMVRGLVRERLVEGSVRVR